MARFRERWPFLFLFTARVFWGGATVLSKYLLFSLPPLTLLAIQLTPSALVLWLIAAAGRARVFDGRSLLPLVLLGLLNPGLSYTLGLLALAKIPASVATLL